MQSLISRDKKYCFGQPRIRGHRITVACIKGWYFNGEGWTPESLTKLYDITKDQAIAAINYGRKIKLTFA